MCLFVDYCLLEGISREVDESSRNSVSDGGMKKQRALLSQCRKRGIDLIFMSAGMQRSVLNCSFYHQKFVSILSYCMIIGVEKTRYFGRLNSL